MSLGASTFRLLGLLALAAGCASGPAPAGAPAAPAGAPAARSGAALPAATSSSAANAGPSGERRPPRAATSEPLAERRPVVRELHGDRFVDDYFWLREKGTKAVEDYLAAENAYTAAALRPIAPLVDALYQEMLGHLQEDDQTVPYKKGRWLYSVRTERGKQYPILVRRPVKGSAVDSVILDQNQLAAGKTFLSIEEAEVSDSGDLLAYTVDDTGFRNYTLRFRDLRTGTDLPDAIPHVVAIAWAAGDRTILYVTEDDAKRAYRLYRHTLGNLVRKVPKAGPAEDPLMYEEKDERFDIDVRRSQSGQYLFVTSISKRTSEVRIIDALHPERPMRVVDPRREDVKYDVDQNGSTLYIRTNDTGMNFRLVTAPIERPGHASWKELRPHDPAVMLEHLMMFRDHYVLHVREGGLPRLEVVELGRGHGAVTRIPMPEADYDVVLDGNREFASGVVRYAYQSLATPPSVYEWDIAARSARLLKVKPVPGYDLSAYQVERIAAQAGDGTTIPISIVSRKDTPRDGSAPLHLIGYGSYGLSLPPYFDATRLPLLDRGVTFAVAHVRGGGEGGKAWHEAGRMQRKKNTFTDFIACAEHLIRERYTSAPHLSIEGRSAGGLLMGAVLNMRPDLFAAALVGVPFVDVINTMNDPSLPLTVTEYEEWGDPRKADEYAYMRSYSPYDNLAPRRYPAILVSSSYNDSQVMYWEPAKYVARLRALGHGDEPLLLRMNMDPAGHRGRSGRYDHLREVATDLAFALSRTSPQAAGTASVATGGS